MELRKVNMTEYKIYFTDGKHSTVLGHNICRVASMPEPWHQILRWEICEKTGQLSAAPSATVMMFNIEHVKSIHIRDVQS